MKTKTTTIQLSLIVIAILTGMLSSCRKCEPFGIRGKGEMITEAKDLSDFNAINLGIDAKVVYTQDENYKVEVKAQSNILSVMDIKTSGSELQIDLKRNVLSHDGITIVVHAPDLNRMQVSGSGSIEVLNLLNEDQLSLSVSGSGHISIPSVSLQTLDARISGSGNVSVDAGSCMNERFDISGSGSINTQFVDAVNGNVTMSGSGSVIINATEKLTVAISGSGKVKYRNRPVITSSISGSGKLIHID